MDDGKLTLNRELVETVEDLMHLLPQWVAMDGKTRRALAVSLRQTAALLDWTARRTNAGIVLEVSEVQ